ncbi:UNVERIFIED_CONTAM: hypothetical protein PYX00_010175 [Menopon gallinae]|uniref:heparosan-N-sulfate-glucuronate 5-epimerase n=1 Tax=Menopon gallinae TaxID=328185 RepID=A0AAW2HEY1_9NEOP
MVIKSANSLMICLCLVLVTLSFWTRCADFQHSIRKFSPKLGELEQFKKLSNSQADKLGLGFEEIECVINQEYSVSCRKEGEEVYLPFSFLHKYFEVYGKLASYDGLEKFEWSHSYSKVYRPKAKYDPRGVFMYFEKYNVEARDRVKCLSAIEGVPISTQWESQGYYYPTQIAQFGLSHYSKNLTEPEPRRKIIEDGGKEMANWQPSNTGATFNRVVQPDGDGNLVLEFQTSDSLASQVVLQLDHVLDLIFQVDIKLSLNSSLTVTLQSRDSREIFYLHYIASDLHISAQNEHTYHGLGSNRWVKITRDLVMDIQKGIIFQGKPKRKISKSKIKIVEISLQGAGYIDNMTLSSSEHLSHFYDAAEWFVNHQDPNTGGWVNPVTRRLASGLAELDPGWCSAMGQGHGISVLARAYFHSGGDMKYLLAAIEALRPFRTPSQDGGVLATFLGQYPWYEEYPTTPSSFVLNGFIYSLLGLYDLKTIAPPRFAKEATALFEQGMRSLKKLLPLFDMGSTSSYDLRHFTLNVAPNIARWDYHATHVNQLLLLNTIDNDPLLSSTAERWLGYMTGKRSTHN